MWRLRQVYGTLDALVFSEFRVRVMAGAIETESLAGISSDKPLRVTARSHPCPLACKPSLILIPFLLFKPKKQNN